MATTHITRSVPIDVDRQVGNLAARQHGVVSHFQLVDCGLSRGAIQTRMRRGWLRPIHRGVYAVGHHRLTERGRWLAAVLAGGGGNRRGSGAVVLSHWSAAALHGLVPRDRGVSEITTTTARPSRTGLRVHRSASLDGSVTTRDGIPCCTVGRTLVDISGSGNDAATSRAWSTAASRKLIRRSELEHELSVAAPRRGTACVRAAYAQDFGYLSQRTRSDLERSALRFCRDFGLPMPRTNAMVFVGGVGFEVDLVWGERRLIVEVDGDRTHGHAAARRSDRGRDLALQLAGWRTIRIGESELLHARSATAERLRASLAQEPLAPAPGVVSTAGDAS